MRGITSTASVAKPKIRMAKTNARFAVPKTLTKGTQASWLKQQRLRKVNQQKKVQTFGGQQQGQQGKPFKFQQGSDITIRVANDNVQTNGVRRRQRNLQPTGNMQFVGQRQGQRQGLKVQRGQRQRQGRGELTVRAQNQQSQNRVVTARRGMQFNQNNNTSTLDQRFSGGVTKGRGRGRGRRGRGRGSFGEQSTRVVKGRGNFVFQ